MSAWSIPPGGNSTWSIPPGGKKSKASTPPQPDRGVGYGGSSNDASDLKKGRRKAAKKESRDDQEVAAYLAQSEREISSSSSILDDTDRLIRALCQTFRNNALAEWSKPGRRPLYSNALKVCSALIAVPVTTKSAAGKNDDLSGDEEQATDRVKLFGTLEEEDSLLRALQDFAQSAKFAKDHTSTATVSSASAQLTAADLTLAERAMQVYQTVEGAVQRYQANQNTDFLSVMSQEAFYRIDLGPLRFDLISQPLSNHHFLTPSTSWGYENPAIPTGTKRAESTKATAQPQHTNLRGIYREITAYRSSLPVEYGSSIFVRAQEGRLDLLRALIIGPDNTPYANGCFFFDIVLPSQYPSQPPKVHLLTTGNGRVRLNPNLYACGKVCLSLLGTWSGPGWISGESTLLQVLLSIQSLILVPDPYFNEPGYERFQGTPQGNSRNRLYNLDVRQSCLQYAIYGALQHVGECESKAQTIMYPEFKEVIQKHFLRKRSQLLAQLEEWTIDQPNLANMANLVRTQLIKLDKAGKQKEPVVYNSSGDSYPQTSSRKKRARQQQEVITLDDDDDDDHKMPARKESTSSTSVSPETDNTNYVGIVNTIDLT
eukprot:CAMPEP_0198287544 /NCGR_PEP_ID=MMETSP1449-20131203/6311_1 /TAXON_ID=420275 /ORGANISM="Attheya septentrionalis, Strain CCMP2084" /LENGTH=599 /DNA_ID=CAMNT_0043985505 /DNA_START=294 /DNA_END=2090 /DNA_ORIENTATION=+